MKPADGKEAGESARGSAPAGEPGVGLDWETARRCGRVVRTFLSSEVGGRAAILGVLLVGMLLVINALNVVNSYVARDFMTAISQRDERGFVRQALFYLAVFAASTVVAVIHRFIEERLGLLWRESMTRRLSGVYLGDHLYHRLNVAGGLANPDQRIADDVRSFTTSTLSLSLIFLNGTLTVLAFSGVLWSISPLLFGAAVAYAGLGSLLAVVFGRPLVRLNYDQSDREADFRSQLIHVRENAEAIALLGYEPQLEARLSRQIAAFAANFRRIIAVNRNLGFFTTGYNYLIQLIPALIVAPLFIYGSAEFGVIPQSAMAFSQLVGAFSLIVTQFPQLSTFAAVVARLNALGEASDKVAAETASDIAIVEDPSRLAFDEVSLLAPQDGRPLVRELSLDVPAGEPVLVVGKDDQATSALLRAAGGLWRTGSGRVVRPPSGEVVLVPERAYLPPGTIRAALVGDASSPTFEDEKIWEALREVGAEAAVRRVGGFDVERDWSEVLSTEEQRLVGMARLLLAKPHFAVLERPAESYGAERAGDFIAALKDRGIGAVALDDGSLAREEFDTVVEIAADGSWTRTGAPEAQP